MRVPIPRSTPAEARVRRRRAWRALGLGAGLLLVLGLPALAAGAGSPPTPLAGEAISGGEALGRSVFGLAVVLALVLAVAWFARRFTGAAQARGHGIQVLSAVPVGNRERVLLVRVGEEQILIGVAPGRVQPLHVLDKPLEDLRALDDAGGETGFAARLKTALRARRA